MRTTSVYIVTFINICSLSKVHSYIVRRLFLLFPFYLYHSPCYIPPSPPPASLSLVNFIHEYFYIPIFTLSHRLVSTKGVESQLFYCRILRTITMKIDNNCTYVLGDYGERIYYRSIDTVFG